MIRRALLVLGLLLLVLVVALAGGAAWLAGTTDGARWLAGQASARLPALEVQVTGGRLWDRLELAQVAWKTPELAVELGRLELVWNPACLLEARVCVRRLELDGVSVDVAGGDREPAPPAEPPGRLELPVSVGIQNLRLAGLTVQTPQAEVKLARLQAGAELADALLGLRGVQMEGLRVRLPAAQPAGASPEPAVDGAPIARPPELSLPLDLRIADLALADARLDQGGQSYPLRRLELAASLKRQQLTLERLAAWLPQGRLRLDGRVTLAGAYPLDLTLDAWLPELRPEGPLEAHLGLSGDLNKLALNARLSGLVRLGLEGAVEPLSPGLPYRAELRWEELGWPLGAPRTVVTRQGRLQARGSLDGYRLELETRLAGAGIPPGRWRLDAEGDWAGARIRRLHGRLLDGELSATGRVGWSGGVSWQADLEATQLRPHGFWEQAPEGRLGGRITGQGRVEDGRWSLALNVPAIEGELQGYPVRLQGRLDRPLDGTWRLQALELRSGVNRVSVRGEVADQLDLAAELELPHLEQLWPGLSGRLEGSLALAGPVVSPSVDARLQGQGVGYRDLALERLELEASVAEAFRSLSRVRLEVTGITRQELSVGRLAVRLSGRRAAHEGELEVSGAPVEGRLRLDGALEEEGLAWAGRLSAATLVHPEMRWRLAEPVELAWRPEQAQVFVGRHCWRHEAAALCLEEPLVAGASGARGRLGLEGFQLAWLQPWLPSGLALEGQLQARVDGRWDGEGLPRVTAEARVPGGRLQATEQEGLELPALALAFQSFTLEGELASRRASARLVLRSEAMGDLTLDATVQPRQPDMPLDGRLELAGLRLGFLRPFLPRVAELDGRLDASGALAGSLQAPRFDGEVRLTEGRVRPDLLSLPVRDITLTARVSGSSARLEGEFAMGDGSGRLGGEADWSGAVPAGRLRLDGSGLDLRYPPIVRLELSPAMEFVLEGDTLRVGGRLDIPSGRITLAELPKGSVPYSDDVVVAGAETESTASGLRIASSVVLRLGDDVRFKGFGAEGRLAGSLDLRQLGTDTAEATGEVRLVEGRYQAYGVKLQIREGRVIFAGPVSQPRIYLEAIREVQDVTAGLRVTGPAENPSVELFSNPPMPDRDVLTYIITGAPPGQETPGQGELLADAALSLGVLGGQRIGGALADELGIQDFRVETGTSDAGTTQVMVSGYLTPNLLVRYGVGVFQPENTLSLRYEFGRRLSLEASSGVHNALDAFYNFRF